MNPTYREGLTAGLNVALTAAAAVLVFGTDNLAIGLAFLVAALASTLAWGHYRDMGGGD